MKKLWSVLLVVCMCCGLLAGCGGKTEKKESSNETKTENIKEYSFEVPKSWKDGENTDELQYYYPDDGMLMVGYSEMNQSINVDAARKEFINAFGDSMDSFKLNAEQSLQIAGKQGYKHEMELTMSDEEWKASMVTFDCDGGVISFMLSVLKDSKMDYNKNLDDIIKSIKLVNGAATEGDNNQSNAEEVRSQVEVRAVPTQDGLMCAFITNNSSVVIDELNVQINFKDDAGTTIDTDEDGHDMVLPGSTVVSRLEAPDTYSNFEIETSLELGAHPKYKNHAADIVVNSNQGDEGIIVEITNNSDVSIDEIEYIAVLYKGDQIATVQYPEDIMDLAAGQTATEKVKTYSEDYDRFEIYLNQAHTFGL